MNLKDRYVMWRLVKQIEWIGGHVLKDGCKLVVWRENEKVVHATLDTGEE